MKTINVKKLSQTAITPTRNYNNDAGLDLYSDEEVYIEMGQTKVVKTNIAISIPIGYYGKVCGRSGLSSKGLFVSGGVIDVGYTGSVDIVLNNFSSNHNPRDYAGKRGHLISKGDKIAQIVLHKIITPSVEVVDSFIEEDLNQRKTNGFGSSDK